MGLIDKIRTLFMAKIAVPEFKKMLKQETDLTKKKGAIMGLNTSPERFEIVLESQKITGIKSTLTVDNFSMGRIMRSNVVNIKKSLNSIKNNPLSPKTNFDEELLVKFEKFAKNMGIVAIGYTKLPREYIFKNKAVIYDNAIVLAYEMDKEKMELAPSSQTKKMIMETYDSLGIAANKLVSFLREQGFSAQAGHPLGGLVLYPALAEKAGLGWHGAHGLLITPEYGPRIRLAAIYTNIANLPIFDEDTNPHRWIGEFCKKCTRCIRKCPPWAILDEPVVKENSILTHIDNDKCFPVFLEYHGCSICIKECAFNKVDYKKIKGNYLKKQMMDRLEIDNMIDKNN